jgi:hypothetical protein
MNNGLDGNCTQRLGIAEGGIFCVPSADTEADLFSFAEDNICCPIEFRHPDNWS